MIFYPLFGILGPLEPNMIIQYWVEAYTNSAPNNVVPAISWSVVDTTGFDTDIDAVIRPLGSGALLAQVPDGTATAGNKRGDNAVDWQMLRNNANQVASGFQSVISGGVDNKAAGQYSAVGGGADNFATGNSATVSGGNTNVAAGGYSVVGGGSSNNASHQNSTISGGNNNSSSSGYATIGGGNANSAGNNATVAGGASNTASGTQSAISGGYQNTASGGSSVIGGGTTNTASATYATCGGGQQNTVNGQYSCIPGGSLGTVRGITGALAYAAGSTQAQFMLMSLQMQTTDATPTRLGFAGTTTQLLLPNNSCYMVDGQIAAHATNGDAAAFKISVGIKRNANAASTALVGSATITTVGADAGAAGWSVSVSADTTYGTLAITVTGQSARTISWSGVLYTSQAVD